MIKNIPFSDLSGFSKLFLDFIDENAFVNSRFPNNNLLNISDADFSIFRKSYSSRTAIKKIIEESMMPVEFDENQIDHLKLITDENSYFVTTGQQPGFLGGPIYTILKTYSAIVLSEKLNEKYPHNRFIPLFWIEDNDHDLSEASISYIMDKSQQIRSVSSFSEINQSEKISVSEIIYNEEISGIIDEISDLLPESQYKAELLDFLKSVYSEGNFLSDAFLGIIDKLTKNSGLLFVKSSNIRKASLWKDLVKKEIERTGEGNSIIAGANSLLLEKGFHIQAKSSSVNLFFNKGKRRYKINYDENKFLFEIDNVHYSKNEMEDLIKSEAECLSPNVLLRPIFQDSVLQSAVYIGGPSEIGYIAQIKELYNYFAVAMPIIKMRHSASLLSPRIARLLSHSGREALHFLRHFDLIEGELNHLFVNSNTESELELAESETKRIFEKLADISENIDHTLRSSALTAMNKSLEHIHHLRHKLNTAEKKKHSEIYDKFREINNFMFPKHTLQERIYSIATFINIFGFEGLISKIREICSSENIQHHII